MDRPRSAYLRWRVRCPFIRRLEAWRMKRKAKEFKVEKRA